MSRADGERLLAALQSGELARVASGVTTLPELARAFGMTRAAYSNTVHRLKSAGHAFPSWWSLIGSGGTDADDFADEDPTLTGVPVMPEPVRPPHVSGAPEGYSVRGESILYDADGEIRAKWVKTKKDDDGRYEALMTAVAGVAEPFRGASDPVEAPVTTDDDLLCVYPFGDPHIGMLAWDVEAGENYDLSIAERIHVAAVDRLVDQAPPAKHGLLINVGDYLHADGQGNTTTAGTRVDMDGRWSKVLAVGIRVMRRCIDRGLEKHEHMTVINARGNHDELASLVISVALAQFYEREPRVTIDTSPEMYQWYRFGLNLIGVHHGHKATAEELMGVMATDCQKDWGETIHRRFYCGHVHHRVAKEVPGVIVEYLRTLAPGDAWHRGEGYRSGRDMMMDVHHRQHGHVDRRIIGIGQIAGYPPPRSLRDYGATP